MVRTRALGAIAAVLTAAVLIPAASIPAEKSPASAALAYHSFDQQAFWQTTKVYCDTCHFGPKARAKLNLENLDLAHLDRNGETWEKVLRKLRSREMPPAGMPRPTAAAYDTMVKAIEDERDHIAQVRPNPGRPTLHRLNRTEYQNAIRDLFALDIDVSEMLPADDIGYGFDNIGDVLQVSPVLLERYLSAARKISRTAVGDMTMQAGYQTYTVSHALTQTERLSDAAPA